MILYNKYFKKYKLSVWMVVFCVALEGIWDLHCLRIMSNVINA